MSSSVSKHKLSSTSGVSCHAWNGARDHIAVCPYSNEVHIYKVTGGGDGKAGEQYTKVATLSEHEQLVSGLDWSSKRDIIVTCAHDRNAYVWEREKENDNKWMPQMTILPSNFNRAALCVQWSPKENKFALGGGAKSVGVCYYQEEENWWVSKLIRKKHNSSVTCVQWHSNNWILATGSSDFKVRLFAASIPSVDLDAPKRKFGELLMEVDVAKNWVHGLCWSPKCTSLAVCSHDSCLHVIQVDDLPNMDKDPKCHTVKFSQLPQCAALFLDENRIVSVGFHDKPLLFSKKDNKWVMEGELVAKDAQNSKKVNSAFASKMGMFGGVAGAGAGSKSKPTYARVKTDIRSLKASTSFSVSGMDQSLDFYNI